MTTCRYHVIHETLYRYAVPVTLSQHLLHLTPLDGEYQRLLHHAVEITPQAADYERYADWFGNRTAWLVVQQTHQQLRLISANSVDVMSRPTAWREASGPAWEQVAQSLGNFPSVEPLEAQECALPSEHAPMLEIARGWILQSFTPACPLLEAARDLMARIHTEFSFDTKASTVSTSVAETFAKRRGVCQDFAHVMVSALRTLGLAARYMSGYILTEPPPGKARLIGADASHAWVSLWCPGLGWVDFDPTNNLQPDLEHVVLGWGRDFADVTPMRGVILGGASHEVEVHVTVMPAGLRSLASLLDEVRARDLDAE